MNKLIKDINWPAFFILIVYPIFLVSLGVSYAKNHTIGSMEILFAIVGYYGSNIAVGVGLHRLWSHNSYKTNKVVEFLLMMLSTGSLQGPVLAWASDHNKHHTYTDKERDPHSPAKFKNPVLGFLWAHIGWMLLGEPSYKSIDKTTLVKLGKNKMLIWQLKHYWELATFMNAVLPAVIGYAIGGTAASAYMVFLFIGLGRALQQQATFCVNSACHFLGSKKYYKGTAGDIWWMAIFLLGENWHNYHHAFPSDYRNGAKWYHFDVHKWIIFAMSKLGWAWDLERTPEVRIQAKVNDVAKYVLDGRKEQLSLLQTKVEQLKSHFYAKMQEIENSSVNLKKQVKQSLQDMQQSLNKLNEQLQSSITLAENPSEKLLRSIAAKVKNTEQSLYKLYKELDLSGKRIFS